MYSVIPRRDCEVFAESGGHVLGSVLAKVSITPTQYPTSHARLAFGTVVVRLSMVSTWCRHPAMTPLAVLMSSPALTRTPLTISAQRVRSRASDETLSWPPTSTLKHIRKRNKESRLVLTDDPGCFWIDQSDEAASQASDSQCFIVAAVVRPVVGQR